MKRRLFDSAVALRVRETAAHKLHAWSLQLQPRVEEDAHFWELVALKTAAESGSREASFDAVWDAVKHLDEQTIALMMMLLVSDAVWSEGFASGDPKQLERFVDLRAFFLLTDRFDDA